MEEGTYCMLDVGEGGREAGGGRIRGATKGIFAQLSVRRGLKEEGI